MGKVNKASHNYSEVVLPEYLTNYWPHLPDRYLTRPLSLKASDCLHNHIYNIHASNANEDGL